MPVTLARSIPLQSLSPVLAVLSAPVAIADPLPAFTPFTPFHPTLFAEKQTGNVKNFRLVKSLCLLKTFSSLLGSEKFLRVASLTAAIESRDEKVFVEGWHSVPQANAALATNSPLTIVKPKSVPRDKTFTSNLFLQHQDMFIIQGRTCSVRSRGNPVEHFIGVDFDSRQIIDSYLTARRPLNETEWKLVGLIDWQQTFAICTRRRPPTQ